jgi:DNA-directed RNA polymerase specialized sigma24 family protein
LTRLNSRRRTLIERLFFDDPPQPYEELARDLGLATGSIGFNRGRCLEKLRKALEELGL